MNFERLLDLLPRCAPEPTADPRVEELTQRVDDLESFNRCVAHDLRGPLAGIASLASLARASLATGDESAVERRLRLIQAQAESSARLVDSLLALARAAEVTLDVHRVDTGAVVREALESLRIDRLPGDLPIDVFPLPAVEADVGLARQVFVNLLGNALKFSARNPDPRIEVGAIGEPGNPILFVRDNGAGFSANDAQRLFRPFNRLHGERYEGFGVGLSIVKRIIDRHGGRIWAQGEPGLGAAFFFSFGKPSQSGRAEAGLSDLA